MLKARGLKRKVFYIYELGSDEIFRNIVRRVKLGFPKM